MKSLQSRLLLKQHGLSHFFTTREGGMSSAPYHSLNVAFHVDDDQSRVLANHALLAETFGYERERLVHMRQIHSDRVVIVDEHHDFSHPPQCDALVTDCPQKPLMVMTADCTPLLMYDPRKKVIAAVHAGRAGAFKNIAAKTIETMQRHFGSNPKEILASLGPSIGSCCYEVGEELQQEALGLRLEYATQKRGGRYYLDVNAILVRQLRAAGLNDENIDDIGHCSACENDLFFSYRAEKGRTGRIAGVIMLSSPQRSP